MKTLSAIQIRGILSGIVTYFEIACKNGIKGERAFVYNVAFEEIFTIYAMLQEMERSLYLPGEIGNENITIVLTCAPGFYINIESVPAIDYRWKVHQQNLQLN